MSTEENKAVVRRFFEAATTGNVDALDDLMIPEIVTHGDALFPLIRGKMRGIQQAELFGVASTGKQLRWHGIAMYRFAGGKIVEHWFNADTLSIVQQMRGLADEVVWE